MHRHSYHPVSLSLIWYLARDLCLAAEEGCLLTSISMHSPLSLSLLSVPSCHVLRPQQQRRPRRSVPVSWPVWSPSSCSSCASPLLPSSSFLSSHSLGRTGHGSSSFPPRRPTYSRPRCRPSVALTRRFPLSPYVPFSPLSLSLPCSQHFFAHFNYFSSHSLSPPPLSLLWIPGVHSPRHYCRYQQRTLLYVVYDLAGKVMRGEREGKKQGLSSSP